MPILCIIQPRPGPRLRAVIVIVIYLAAFHLAPDSVALAFGGVLGGLLAIESATAARATRTQERS